MAQHRQLGKTVWNFVALHWTGTLATVSRTLEGYPFGSVVPYDVDEKGRIIIFISQISEHYRNLKNDPRASVCIVEAFALGDVQQNARATVVGDFEPVSGEEVEASYWRRFPEAPERALAHTFEFWRLTPIKVRWIGGFGEISWLSAADYESTPADPVAYAGRGIIEHMNTDHQDALFELLEGYGSVTPRPRRCRMSSVDYERFVISYEGSRGIARAEVAFPYPLESPQHARDGMIALLKNLRG